jgi:Mrp family chromosome partitioning ATPase
MRDVLTGRYPLLRAVRETTQTGLLALPSGESGAEGASWPAASALRSILHDLRRHVDLVLVDGPAWEDGPEMASLSMSCDAMCLVLRPGEIDTPAVMDLLRLIPHVGGHVGGYIVAERAPSMAPTERAS